MSRTAWPHLEGATFDLEGMPLDECLGHPATSLSHHALERRPGDAHLFRRLGLGQALQIGQAQGLQFLLEQRDLAELIQRDASGFIDRGPRCTR